jgi:uncharacterized protein (TIGR02284 family)
MTGTATHSALDTLHELLEINIDAVKYLDAAAGYATAPEFKKMLTDFATQRRQWIADLQTRITAANHEAKEDGTLRGFLQRGWLDLRGYIPGTKDTGLVRQVLETEEEVRSRYESIRPRVEGPIASMVRRQYEGLLAVGRALVAMEKKLSSTDGGQTGA